MNCTGGKIPKISRLLDKSLDVALSSAFLNGRSVQNEQDCDVVLHEINIRKARTECGRYWNELLATNGLPQFSDLDIRHPEHIARNYVPMIQKSLNWYSDELSILEGFLHDFQIPEDVVFLQSALDSDIARIGKILSAIDKSLPNICEICLLVLQIDKYTTIILKTKGLLENGIRTSSKICNSLIDAITRADTEAYRCSYFLLKDIYEKYALRKTRSELLQQLSVVAPQWAEAIELRQGIHGEVTVPATIDDAWKWKQLSGILSELAGVSFGELQEDSIRLGKAYRRTTALYAEKSAWYHLMKATERNLDIRMALQGWKQTIKKIGKGTGKNAPRLKAKARELMGKCQTAVPGWIMPIGRALESLNPQINKFDVVIIDEASQSDISSLAILYMGKKLIIVGDDKQVSPMAVGVEADKMTALEEMYLKGKIPNSHLYNAKTSIYDIAATVFQPLMLREHFRCVPEIIGFSNALSYDGKIKPLRDASSSVLLPAVVNYRVEDGERNGRAKTNQNEARAIIALLKACMEQPEYTGKTFGIISMLGDEQVKVLQRLMFEYIEGKEITDRHILIGNASNFQGDERDVIFLSIVDSSDFSGPLSLTAFGPDDAYRKRYNVASSRAKDQLWVVDSLNPVTDLKLGDIRKMLIDYSINPDQIELQHKQIEEDAESPFEASVAKALNDKGFHLIQQKQVGAYRLDMVVVCDKNAVAIECDGEKYHSGEAKIREDMERQTILERLGWKFIRIRGSEYYRDPDSSIERVINEMDKLGIYPESNGDIPAINRDTELLRRVKARASAILNDNFSSAPSYAESDSAIAAALNGKRPFSVFSTNITDSEVHDSRVMQPLHTAQSSANVREKSATIAIKTDDQSDMRTKVNSPSKQSHSLSLKKASNRSSAPVTKSHDGSPVGKRKERTPISAATQEVIAGMEELLPDNGDVLDFLSSNGISYIDKRSKGGVLWVIGGKELSPIIAKCKTLGFNFRFKAGGGRVTRGKDAWWAK